MTNERRSGGRSGKSTRSGGVIPQLPWRTVENPYPPLELASAEQIEALHKTSMRILSELGIRVMGDNVLKLFAAAGAIVDRAEMTVRIDESLVAQAVSTAPSSTTLTSRNPDKRLTLGGRNVVFGLVAGPPNVHDCIRGRRHIRAELGDLSVAKQNRAIANRRTGSGEQRRIPDDRGARRKWPIRARKWIGVRR